MGSHLQDLRPLDQNNDTMNLDCYTQHIPLTSKARFWSNFVSALKGSNDLYASPVPHVKTYYPSIVEALPTGDMKLKHEFGKLEDLMWRGRRGTSLPPTPVLPEANDRDIRLLQEQGQEALLLTTSHQ